MDPTANDFGLWGTIPACLCSVQTFAEAMCFSSSVSNFSPVMAVDFPGFRGEVWSFYEEIFYLNPRHPLFLDEVKQERQAFLDAAKERHSIFLGAV